MMTRAHRAARHERCVREKITVTPAAAWSRISLLKLFLLIASGGKRLVEDNQFQAVDDGAGQLTV